MRTLFNTPVNEMTYGLDVSVQTGLLSPVTACKD